jgi:hypothetical protein
MLNYFECIRISEMDKREEFLSESVNISRHRLHPVAANAAQWRSCDKPLQPFESLDHGVIEGAHDCLQVDFANKFIGGGVLRRGSVQVMSRDRCRYSACT